MPKVAHYPGPSGPGARGSAAAASPRGATEAVTERPRAAAQVGKSLHVHTAAHADSEHAPEGNLKLAVLSLARCVTVSFAVRLLGSACCS